MIDSWWLPSTTLTWMPVFFTCLPNKPLTQGSTSHSPAMPPGYPEVFLFITSSLSFSMVKGEMPLAVSSLQIVRTDGRNGGHTSRPYPQAGIDPTEWEVLAAWGAVGCDFWSNLGSWAYIRMVNSFLTLCKSFLPACFLLFCFVCKTGLTVVNLLNYVSSGYHVVRHV